MRYFLTMTAAILLGISTAFAGVPVKKPTFNITLPDGFTFAAPERQAQNNMVVYNFSDNPSAPKQAMTVMVVPVDHKHMDHNLNNASRQFASGILMGFAKQAKHPIRIKEARGKVHPVQINGHTLQKAEYVMPSGIVQIYTGHTMKHIYGFVLTSKNPEYIVEMIASLSSVEYKG